jgi:2-polyprenyl-3-methyl-5-hydroxy-6-metoxy-1,4-benzoquinol methylase
MDRLIKRLDATPDADLILCAAHGIAYQADMKSGRVKYDASYLAKVDAYEGGAIAKAVNAGRCALLGRHLQIPLSPPLEKGESLRGGQRSGGGFSVLDVGSGSGAFVRAAKAAGFNASGWDVIPDAVARLLQDGTYADDPATFDAVTLWDTLEHMEDPELRLRQVSKGALLFVSIPVFDDLGKIRESKHYRPGEHLYYWTAQGFIDWMSLYGFRLLEQSDHETAAGRESIGAFAFCRDLPDYGEHIVAYREIHSTRHYGSSATDLHLAQIAKMVQTYAPASILDYGCGRSDLAAHFWLDGARRIARYDPAIPAFKTMPDGRFDMVLVCDVMEHIPMASVDRVLKEVHEKSSLALFTISTKLARAKLPDGRNAHVTLLTKSEWINWLADEFGKVEVLPSEWEHELILLAGSSSPPL